MTDAEYLRVVAKDSSFERANQLLHIADRIEAAERDGQRYRKLRDGGVASSVFEYLVSANPDDWDEAIDTNKTKAERAAMKDRP